MTGDELRLHHPQKAAEAALTAATRRSDLTSAFRRRPIWRSNFSSLPVVCRQFWVRLLARRHQPHRARFASSARLAGGEIVAAVPGITFGPQSDRYIRIAFTIGDADLKKGIERLLDYMK